MSDIEKWGETFTWLKDESGKTYFELKTAQLDGLKVCDCFEGPSIYCVNSMMSCADGRSHLQQDLQPWFGVGHRIL